MNAVIYIHGKGGSAAECEHYKSLFPDCEVIGLDYQTSTPWETCKEKAYFISPIVDMEKLITNMMQWANVTEQELESEGVIHTDFGEDLSWEYLSYVRSYLITWHAPTQILYGSNDLLTSLETISDFANKHQATLTVMEGGEHWFHTEDQMQFLDRWIKKLI
jgi:pimeloyl-ACP methyl ester carboxylesterase